MTLLKKPFGYSYLGIPLYMYFLVSLFINSTQALYGHLWPIYYTLISNKVGVP